jgi:hypothetical protein
MTTMQKRRTVKTNDNISVTPSSTVEPSSTESLLGAEIHLDMRLKQHILEIDNVLVKALNKRQGALQKIQKKASFRSRKLIANGIFMSKLIYLMLLWSGCEEYIHGEGPAGNTEQGSQVCIQQVNSYQDSSENTLLLLQFIQLDKIL